MKMFVTALIAFGVLAGSVSADPMMRHHHHHWGHHHWRHHHHAM
jgi:hypothetical protein